MIIFQILKGDHYIGSIFGISFEAPSSPHDKVLTTSSEPEIHLNDVIERIEKMRLDENSTPSQSTEKDGPSHKGPPKWLTKTLKNVHLVRSERQELKCPQCKF
jgi:hypothetical protein